MSQKNNTANYEIKRLDHLGIVAGVIKDLKIIEMIDERLGTYEGESLSAGETVAGMIINGLGFSNKPLSLTPLFFEQCPLELLFRDGVNAEDFNRFKLGRVLDRCYNYGTELLFSEISFEDKVFLQKTLSSKNVCRQEKVDTRFNSEDTTSFTLSGDYSTETDEESVEVKLGYSKDHRPDLKQVSRIKFFFKKLYPRMLEMMVSQDGGIPLIGKCLNGNSSDNTVFKERSEQLIEQFKQSETPRYLIADSKLYTEENASNLKKIPFITRIPNNIKFVTETISKAVENTNSWQSLDDGRSMQTFNLEHYGMKQRWHVLSSETSLKRADKQVDKRVIKEYNRIKQQIFHLQAQRFDSIEDAIKTVEKLAKKWKLHQLEETKTIEHNVYKTKGRPKKGQIPNKIQFEDKVFFQKTLSSNIKF